MLYFMLLVYVLIETTVFTHEDTFITYEIGIRVYYRIKKMLNNREYDKHHAKHYKVEETVEVA